VTEIPRRQDASDPTGSARFFRFGLGALALFGLLLCGKFLLSKAEPKPLGSAAIDVAPEENAESSARSSASTGRLAESIKRAQPSGPKGAAPGGEDRPEKATKTTSEREAIRIRSEVKLVEALDSDKPEDKRAAIEALAYRKSTRMLPKLLSMDIRDAYVAPTLIDAIGKLGGEETGPMKQSALERLRDLLKAEKQRREADAVGNVLQIIEALGELRSPDAAATLEQELADSYYDAANRVLIVEQIGKLGYARSLPTLKRVKEEPAPKAGGEDLAQEFYRDLQKAADKAIEAAKK
jgi:hypothetical protein